MKRIFCFLDTQESYCGQLEEFIEKCDKMGDEVHLYTNIIETMMQPADIIYMIDSVNHEKNVQIQKVFLSNIPNLFHIIYRLYHQLFDQFIIYKQDYEKKYHFDDVVFQLIDNSKSSEVEDLYKPIYTNDCVHSFKNCNIEMKSLSSFLTDTEQMYNYKPDEFANIHPITRKYYFINGEYYLFEPVISENKIILVYDISLNEAKLLKREFRYPGYSRVHYMYYYNLESIHDLIVLLDNLSKNVNKIFHLLEIMEEEIKSYYGWVLQMTCCVLDDLAQLNNQESIARLLIIYSYLMQVSLSPCYLNILIRNSIHNIHLSCENRYYIWNQCKRYLLTKKVLSDENTYFLMRELYSKIYNEFAASLSFDLYHFPKEERNKNTIIIFTIQFLSEKHAPTRTTLERCYTLSKLLGYNVLLINTKEQLTRKGGLLLYNPCIGNYVKDYDQVNDYKYKDQVIPFFQPSDDMPSINAIRDILGIIRKWKPYFIFSIGDGSIVADLCGRVVPQAAIGVAFSKLPTTTATFSIIGRKIEESEWESLKNRGYQRDNIIESTFTFELNPQKGLLTREEYNIPRDRFTLVTVGIRLDYEIDEEFIKTIIETFKWGTHIVFAGYFDKYGYFCDKYPIFRDHSTFIGFCDDILSLMDICDLYVNPRRLGGGFSIIEAFHQGKPGVTLKMGDIAVAAGEEFCVINYKEMQEIIKRYIIDKDFYNIMVEKAKEREKVVTDSATAMSNILKKIQVNPLFF